jgi:glycosyltransferase involved in cell wall biosynthesis
MRILLVQETDWLSKGPFQQNHLMERLSLKHHEVSVIDHEILWKLQKKKTLRSKRQVFNDVSRIYRGAKVTLIRPGIIKIPNLDYVSLFFSHRREIERQIQEFKPDIIVGFHILSAYLGMQAAIRHDIPFVYYWVDVYHTQLSFPLYQFVGQMLEKRTLHHSNRVVVINEKLRDHVIRMSSNPVQTHVVRGSVDLERFNPTIDSAGLRAQYGIEKDNVILIFMGWLYNFSGLKEVALQLTQVNDPKLKLLIVGEGDAYEELQKIRDKYSLQNKVVLTGNKHYWEIPSFVAAADICLLPARPNQEIMQDIVPIKMYEYMAMKKPVIATRLPGVMKEFGEGNGVVYVDKPEDVVAKALELVQDNRVEDLGTKARNFVERYGWDNIIDKFERILKEAITDKGRRMASLVDEEES